MANSLSTYVSSEGRRPDLKVIDDIQKTEINSSGDGIEKAVTTSPIKSNLTLEGNKLNVQDTSICLSYKENTNQHSDSSISDNSDLEENILFQTKKVKMRPAFNCKKKLIAHFK